MARTLEQQIRKVIKQHYGENLWMFREDVNYREGTEDFVRDVAKAIRGELEYLSDLPNPIAKYSRMSTIDRALGGFIKELRIKRCLTQEQLAKKVNFRVDFLDHLEKGHVNPGMGVWGDAYHALEPTDEEGAELGKAFESGRNREDMIREVIELYYGWNLWIYKPEVSYEEAIEPFVKSLASLWLRS